MLGEGFIPAFLSDFRLFWEMLHDAHLHTLLLTQFLASLNLPFLFPDRRLVVHEVCLLLEQFDGILEEAGLLGVLP